MIKIASCELCGRYYRTGKIRQVIEKALGEGNKFKEWRKAVCNGCYDSIIKGEGVKLSFNAWDEGDEIIEGDSLGAKEEKVYKVKEVKPNKERKKHKVHDSEIARSIRAGTGELAEDEDVDKEEPKKRGRKPKSRDTDPLATEASAEPKKRGRKSKVDKGTDVVLSEQEMRSIAEEVVKETGIGFVAPEESKVSKFDQAFPSPESIANTPPVEPVEEESTPVSAKDRKYYKDKVREALVVGAGTILYSDVAKKLGIDEGLVSQLVDEIDVEG